MNNSIFFFKRQSLYENLLIISLFFAPYTLLRIGRIGVSELSVIMLITLVFTREKLARGFCCLGNFVFSKFWILYLLFSFIGFIFNFFFLGFPSGSIQGFLFDSASYLLILICCFALESIIHSEFRRVDIWKILKTVYFSASIALLLLFAFGRLTNSSWIMHYGFFRPFAMNIHHISMFMAPLPFIGLKILSKFSKKTLKGITLFLLLSNILVGISTGSLKVLISFLFGSIVMFFALPFRSKLSKDTKYLMIAFFLLAFSCVTFIYGQTIVGKASSFFVEHDIQDARYYLYQSAIRKAAISPIFGLGPGPHAEIDSLDFSDAHQTFFSALLQSGVLGVFLYSFLSFVILKRCSKDIYLLGGYSSILVYSLGGDILRRLPMWLFMVMFYYLSDLKEASKARKSSC